MNHEAYDLAVQTLRDHVARLHKRAQEGHSLTPAEVGTLLDVARALRPAMGFRRAPAHHPSRQADAGKPVKELLEEAAREFPELAEAMAALGDG